MYWGFSCKIIKSSEERSTYPAHVPFLLFLPLNLVLEDNKLGAIVAILQL